MTEAAISRPRKTGTTIGGMIHSLHANDLAFDIDRIPFKKKPGGCRAGRHVGGRSSVEASQPSALVSKSVVPACSQRSHSNLRKPKLSAGR
jgi:hypothetical protein